MLTATVSGQTDGKSKLRSRNYYQLFIIITIIFAIIITTWPKPAYGLGWAGPWGQNTVQAATFWGLLHVSSDLVVLFKFLGLLKKGRLKPSSSVLKITFLDFSIHHVKNGQKTLHHNIYHHHHHQERRKVTANAHESQCGNLSPAFNGQVFLSLIFSTRIAFTITLWCCNRDNVNCITGNWW